MRSLISGIIGLLLGSMFLLSSLLRGGPRGQGAFFVGQMIGMLMGVLFLVGGVYYAFKGGMEVKAGPQGNRNRKRPIYDDDDDDDDDDRRPRRTRRSRDDDDDDDDDDDRCRRKRRSRDDDDDDDDDDLDDRIRRMR